MKADNDDDLAADAEDRKMAIHDEKAKFVHDALVGLYQQLEPNGMTSAALCEGAIKGAATVMLAGRGASLDDVAGIFEDYAKALRGGDELMRH